MVQLGVRLVRNEEVGGSNPPGSTRNKKTRFFSGFFWFLLRPDLRK